MSIMWVARSSRRVPTEQAATPDEVREAIGALTQADLLRLESFAYWRIRGLGRRSGGRTHKDLINDAICVTLDGTRRWNKSKVDFVKYLIGTMSSISDNWRKRYRSDEPILASDLGHDDESGVATDVLERAQSDAPSPEDRLVMKEHADAIRRLFEGDALVTLIICEIEEGSRLQEIRERYAIDTNDFNAALKRLRRKIARWIDEGGDG